MQQVWRKRWRHTAWFALAAVTLVLLVSAVYKKNHSECKGVEVTFSGDGNNFFIEEKGVIGLLKANGLVIGQPVEAINLKTLEDVLKKDRWIAKADLFFDNNQVLQVKVEEKTPVARIFTTQGNSFYIDSACRKLPLSEKLSARIPMVTNFPSDRPTLSKPDSELLASVKELAMFIQEDDFWKAQVAQIDITPEGFEMIPTVGSHVVVLGDGNDFQQKFDRLFSFYKQVWTKVGFEKYEKVDVRFTGQVVATLKGAKPAIVDSQKVRMAYEKLVAEAQKPAEDSISVRDEKNGNTAPVMEKVPSDAKVNVEVKRKLPATGNIAKAAAKKQPVKHQIIKTATQRQTTAKNVRVKQVASNKQVEDRRVPKAVMRKTLTSKGG
ncbi:cell division protein FtsQ/DivIB [Segetibacter koreensis]|uniref:cell division protein FtsQ/DivIB n=1 Tax=Segetibacter koreensis TaxID=398037 RepID=UPI0003755564|nr:hypothetical protein [Segetibacter koreensis]